MCEHFVGLVAVDPVTDVCDECLAVGDRWVHLRACLVCGNVGCCDASKNRHARGHWQRTDHAVIKTIEPGESWKYCFADGLVTL